jgi:hypothetical protein
MEYDLNRVALIERERHFLVIEDFLDQPIYHPILGARRKPDFAGHCHIGGEKIDAPVCHCLIDPPALSGDRYFDVQTAKQRRV